MSTPFEQKKWSLNDLFSSANDPEIESTFAKLEEQINAFEKNRARLTDQTTSTELLEIISQLESCYQLSARLNGFAELSFAENTQNQQAQTFLARIAQLNAEIENRVLFFTMWWKDLSDTQAVPLLQASGDYHYWLEQIRHFKPYTLTEAEEKIINIKNITGVNALNTLYDSITNRFTFKLTVNGEELDLTRDELMVYARNADPDLRAQAYQSLFKVYGHEAPILGQIYQVVARDWRNENVDLRKLPQPISARNLVNDIPDEVVDTLLDVSARNVAIFQRFFLLKAHLLGKDRLRRYDIYAPVVHSDKKYDFSLAADMVFDAFTNFDPQMATLARRVFEKDHLDSGIFKGKTGGAFCASIMPGLTPWVLTNYQGRAQDVTTLAHELGHAIHSMLAAQHSLFTFQACLPLAETASTFGEMMLVDYLLQREPDEQVRRDLLFRQVDDSYGTVIRQSFFSMFERQAHEMIHQGASVDELSDAYIKNLQKQFGNSIEINDDFRYEWVSIPHFYNVPFYVYAYAFGKLLVLSLYQQYKEEGASFKPRYMNILRAGGSVAPVELLGQAGIDIRKAEFWQGGYDILDNMVKQLENLK